jgi:hypothetical protein
MSRVPVRTMLVLMLVVGPVLSGACVSTDIAFTVGYPVGTLPYMAEAGYYYETPPLFYGAYVVTSMGFGNPKSPMLLDASVLYWPDGSMFALRAGLGLGGDLWILHTSIALSAVVIHYSPPGYLPLDAVGADLTARLGLKLGPVIIGAGLSAPLGALLRAVTMDTPFVRTWQDELLLFSGQLTTSIGWAIEPARSAVR